MGEAARFFFMLNIQVCTKDGKKLNGNLMYTIRPIGEVINYNLKKTDGKKYADGKTGKDSRKSEEIRLT